MAGSDESCPLARALGQIAAQAQPSEAEFSPSSHAIRGSPCLHGGAGKKRQRFCQGATVPHSHGYLTATRTNEVLLAKWEEVDLENAIWTIPAERMKARREHRVPLSDAALAILKSLPRIEDNPHVFPGAHHGGPLSNMALLQLMRKMGYGREGKRGPYVPHGFRSSFRDWVGEVSNFPRDLAEMALAHVIENKAEAAYRRGDLFAKRRKMMQAWTNFVMSEYKAVEKVITMGRRR